MTLAITQLMVFGIALIVVGLSVGCTLLILWLINKDFRGLKWYAAIVFSLALAILGLQFWIWG